MKWYVQTISACTFICKCVCQTYGGLNINYPSTLTCVFSILNACLSRVRTGRYSDGLHLKTTKWRSQDLHQAIVVPRHPTRAKQVRQQLYLHNSNRLWWQFSCLGKHLCELLASIAEVTFSLLQCLKREPSLGWHAQ